jgi:superfamily II DNA/RNA helicase
MIGPWTTEDGRAPGVYCASCGAVLDADVGELGLEDSRVEFVSPEDFSAEEVAAELMGLRPDAEWVELEMPPRDARFAPTPSLLDARVAQALQRTGREKLFTYQAEAITRALEGRNVIQATAAGSRKSLALFAPVLNALLQDPAATAIVAFPLKALASDQMNALARLGLYSDRHLSQSSFDLVLADN